MTVQTALGVTVLTALLTCKVPDDQSLVARCREEHVGAAKMLSASFLFLFFLFSCFSPFSCYILSAVDYILFHAGCERGDPATVAVELTAHDQLLSHIVEKVCGDGKIGGIGVDRFYNRFTRNPSRRYLVFFEYVGKVRRKSN